MKTEQTKLEDFDKSLTIKYSRPAEQIGIAWVYGGLEDLQGLLDEPIPEIFFTEKIVERMEHHPNESGMGGKIVFFYKEEYAMIKYRCPECGSTEEVGPYKDEQADQSEPMGLCIACNYFDHIEEFEV